MTFKNEFLKPNVSVYAIRTIPSIMELVATVKCIAGDGFGKIISPASKIYRINIDQSKFRFLTRKIDKTNSYY